MGNERIKLTDTLMDSVMKLTEGNPGALRVIMDIVKDGKEIDPYTEPFLLLLNLDSYGIYGPRIWMFFKDVCKCNLSKTIAVLRAMQMGVVPAAIVNHAIDNYGKGVDLDVVIAGVKDKLPKLVITE